MAVEVGNYDYFAVGGYSTNPTPLNPNIPAGSTRAAVVLVIWDGGLIERSFVYSETSYSLNGVTTTVALTGI